MTKKMKVNIKEIYLIALGLASIITSSSLAVIVYKYYQILSKALGQ